MYDSDLPILATSSKMVGMWELCGAFFRFLVIY